MLQPLFHSVRCPLFPSIWPPDDKQVPSTLARWVQGRLPHLNLAGRTTTIIRLPHAITSPTAEKARYSPDIFKKLEGIQCLSGAF